MMEWGDMETGYLFTSKELAVLLTAAGGEGLAGFSLQNIEMDRGQVLYQLYSLFKKGILLPKEVDRKLEILPALKPAISACVHARYILCIEQLNPTEKPFAVCYPSEKGWSIMRPCDELPDGWLLQWGSTEDVIELLKDNGLLPSNADDLERLEERFPLRVVQGPAEDMIPISSFTWIEEKTREIVSSTKIARGILMDWLLTINSEQVYTEKKLAHWMDCLSEREMI